jgi:hypothetical protein
LIAVAREKGVSAYVVEGRNRWSAAHVSDVARLYRLVWEKNEAGAKYHAVGEEGVSTRDIAETIGRGLRIPQSKAQTDKMGESLGKTDALIQRATEQAKATNNLARQAKRSADIAQQQNVPWVGIEQPIVITAYPEYVWSPALPYPSIWVNTGFSVKNYGLAPAFLEHEETNLRPVPDKGQDLPSLRKACMIDAYRTPGQVSLKGDIGEMILPGAIKASGIGQNMTDDAQTTKALKQVWITICIVYQDQRAKWHYSGYRYITTSGTGNAIPITFSDHPGWSYLPYNKAVLIAASAE